MNTNAAALASGKGHKDENFPVASWLVRPDARGAILAFYNFARAADDVADNPTASAARRLALLGDMRAGLAATPVIDGAHAHDLLDAFVQDVRQNRYQGWDELIAYCRLSAMPVGRFVLDVHGEDRALWPMNDALCAALQIINHLQDCGKDFRALGRCYLPEPLLTEAGVPITALAEPRATPALRAVIAGLARQTEALLAEAAPFARRIKDPRLAAEVAVIHALAQDLTRLLLTRDPLSETVHHSKPRAAMLAFGALLRHGLRRMLP